MRYRAPRWRGSGYRRHARPARAANPERRDPRSRGDLAGAHCVAARRSDGSGGRHWGIRRAPWAGLLAPKGTPPAIIATLNAATRDVLGDPDIKQRLETAVGGEVRGSSPGEMKALIETEIAKWTGVVERAKIPKI
uniref:tripartite tricarboxylate transporter substrate-binding protein n=1 Tax=Bradyrhizobium sp. Oc8 TaxID=2876780 RepID=UPI00320A214D